MQLNPFILFFFNHSVFLKDLFWTFFVLTVNNHTGKDKFILVDTHSTVASVEKSYRLQSFLWSHWTQRSYRKVVQWKKLHYNITYVIYLPQQIDNTEYKCGTYKNHYGTEITELCVLQSMQTYLIFLNRALHWAQHSVFWILLASSSSAQ